MYSLLNNPLSFGTHESSCASVFHSAEIYFINTDKSSSYVAVEGPVTSRSPGDSSLDKIAHGVMKEPFATSSKERETVDRWKSDALRAEVDLRQQPGTTVNRISTDRPPKDTASNGHSATATQQENVRPLLSLLDKEPPSRHFSGQLEYVRHLTGLEKHESILPLLQAPNDKKANDLDFLMAEFEGGCYSFSAFTSNMNALIGFSFCSLRHFISARML